MLCLVTYPLGKKWAHQISTKSTYLHHHPKSAKTEVETCYFILILDVLSNLNFIRMATQILA
jgi:hypothetical protein